MLSAIHGVLQTAGLLLIAFVVVLLVRWFSGLSWAETVLVVVGASLVVWLANRARRSVSD